MLLCVPVVSCRDEAPELSADASAFEATPEVVEPGEAVTLTPGRGENWAGPNFVLDQDSDVVHDAFVLHGGDAPAWVWEGTRIDALPSARPDPGAIDVGAIDVVVPGVAEPGSYLLCGGYLSGRTACATLEVTD